LLDDDRRERHDVDALDNEERRLPPLPSQVGPAAIFVGSSSMIREGLVLVSDRHIPVC
jgi:hypothetical protein